MLRLPPIRSVSRKIFQRCIMCRQIRFEMCNNFGTPRFTSFLLMFIIYAISTGKTTRLRIFIKRVRQQRKYCRLFSVWFMTSVKCNYYYLHFICIIVSALYMALLRAVAHTNPFIYLISLSVIIIQMSDCAIRGTEGLCIKTMLWLHMVNCNVLM